MMQLWSRRAWHFLRTSVLAGLLSAAAVVAWGVACKHQSIVATLQPAVHLASITASRSSVFDEFNRWAVYNMQKVQLNHACTAHE